MPETTTCPVCGMPVEVVIDTPATTLDGEMHYFCSDGCKEEFDRHPDRYTDA